MPLVLLNKILPVLFDFHIGSRLISMLVPPSTFLILSVASANAEAAPARPCIVFVLLVVCRPCIVFVLLDVFRPCSCICVCSFNLSVVHVFVFVLLDVCLIHVLYLLSSPLSPPSPLLECSLGGDRGRSMVLLRRAVMR